jgi:hypothetical protein
MLSGSTFTVIHSSLTDSFLTYNTKNDNNPLLPGPHAPLCMYEGHFDFKGPLNANVPLDDRDSLWAGSGSDNSLLNPDNWLQDDNGVWRPIDDSDDEVEVLMPAQHPPSLPPTFQVDPVHLNILELPEHLCSQQATTFHLLSKDDRRTMFLRMA